MMKVVINSGPGGFDLSDDAYEYLISRGVICEPENKCGYSANEFTIYKSENSIFGNKYWCSYFDKNKRSHPLLIEVVETLGSELASGSFASLKIVKIPDDVDFEIQEYGGNEWIAEKHRTWD